MVNGPAVVFSEFAERLVAVCDFDLDILDATSGSRVLDSVLNYRRFNFLIDVHSVMEPYERTNVLQV